MNADGIRVGHSVLGYQSPKSNKYDNIHIMNRLTYVGLEGMGMVFGIGRKDAQDVQNAPQSGGVPYKLASYDHDHEGKRFKSSNVVYSFWSASKYVLILSLILWWLPMFGQMIAGYVGGRRAGGPWKGVAASIMPVICLYVVMTGFDSGFFPSHFFGVAIAPAAIGASLSESIPFFSPYVHFSSEYIGAFVDTLSGASAYGINTYILTVAFAYVGGILAEQNRREIEFNSGSMMSNTTVLVADNAQQQQQLPSYATPNHSLAHMFSAMFPWSRDHQMAQQGHLTAAHASHWDGAVPMRYGEVDHHGRAAAAPMLPGHVYQDEPATFSRATAKRTKHRAERKPHQRKSDPWVRAQRRANQSYSSARRLRMPEDEGERTVPAQRPAPRSTQRFVPGDTRSIKKARKVIDAEWGRKSYPPMRQRPNRAPSRHHELNDSEVPELPHPQPKAHKPSSNHWDSI